MSNQFQQYKGTFPYKTDSKNRVNVVAGWRPQQGEAIYLMPSKHKGVNMIKVLTDEGVAHRLQTVDENVANPKERAEKKADLKRILRDSNVNDQGKILIPKDFAAYAGINPDSDVMLSAGDSHFEIWNRAKYEEIYGTLGVSLQDDDLGIY